MGLVLGFGLLFVEAVKLGVDSLETSVDPVAFGFEIREITDEEDGQNPDKDACRDGKRGVESG